MPAPRPTVAALVLLLLAVVAGWWALRPDPPAAPAGGAGAASARDLERDERAGGHTLSRHVGLDDPALRRRLEAEPSLTAASSFADRATAERAVAEALEAGSERIERWLDSGRKGNLVVRWAGNGRALGRVLVRGARSPVEATRVRAVLRRDGAGYYVLTAYPEIPR